MLMTGFWAPKWRSSSKAFLQHYSTHAPTNSVQDHAHNVTIYYCCPGCDPCWGQVEGLAGLGTRLAIYIYLYEGRFKMPVDVQTWRVRVGLYNAGRLSDFRSRYGRPKTIKSVKGPKLDALNGCGTLLDLLGLGVMLSLLHGLFRGRLDLSELFRTIRVRCGGSNGVSSIKMAFGAAVLLLVLAITLCLLLLLAGDVERNPGPYEGILFRWCLPAL